MTSEKRDHRHYLLHVHSYWDDRRQTDEICRNRSCIGVGRVSMFYAPDVGRNWVKCCCCGDEWIPGYH